MSTVTYSDEKVEKELSEGWVFLKVHKSENEKTLNALGVKSIPMQVIMTADGEVKAKIPGFVPPDTFLKQIKEVSDAHAGNEPENEQESKKASASTDSPASHSVVLAIEGMT